MYGDRKFNFIGKCNYWKYLAYVWSKKHKLYLELVYDPDKKGFFSLSKKVTTSDYLIGDIVKVS